ncbi:hypothetical protein SBV1_770025 [Verrucomicrobia bacterium]|nr:hypothetical protein SBV1_770025 [Verrucomicrobiota bacterium]
MAPALSPTLRLEVHTRSRVGGASRTVLMWSNNFAVDPGIFVEFVDSAQPVVAIRDHNLTVVFVSYEKERGETLALPNPYPVLLDM